LIKIGDHIGKYEILEQIGRGAAGSVFRAKDHFLDEVVCIKALHPQFAKEPAVVERFKRELIVARKISHHGVCKAFDITEHDGEFLLVMEFVPGETLAMILNRGAIPVPRAIRLMRETAAAIGAAHDQGIVHRDLKPGNIIVTTGPDGEETVKVVDFGVAALEGSNRLTRPGVMVGSLSYIAPEVWEGHTADVLADVWALGVILYGCVTGTLPYRGEGFAGVYQAIRETTPTPPSEINPQVSKELEEAISRSMCIARDERFQRTQDFVDALDAIAGDEAFSPGETQTVATEDLPTLAPSNSGEIQGQEAAMGPPGDPSDDDLVAVTGTAEDEDAYTSSDKTDLVDPTSLAEASFHGLDDNTQSVRPLPDPESAPGPSDSSADLETTQAVEPLVLQEIHGAPAPVSGVDNPVRGELESPPETTGDDALNALATAEPLPDETVEASDGAAIVGEAIEPSLPPIVGEAIDEPTPQTQVVAMEEVDGAPPKKGLPLPLIAAGVGVVLVIVGFVLFGGDDPPGDDPERDPVVGATADAGAVVNTVDDPDDPDDPPEESADAGDSMDFGLIDDPTERPLDEPLDDPPPDDPPPDDPPPDDPPPDDPPPDDPPPDVKKQPRPAGNPDRSRYVRKNRAVASLAASRGFIGGDVPKADRARSAARKLSKKKKYGDATRKLADAERLIKATTIDQAFVTKKLQRFNRLYDKASAAKKKKVGPMIKDVGKALSANKFKTANRALNRAIRALR
jgi:serine/threonine protein kinase